VNRLPHFRHSRRRRIDSASLLSRESTTLSLENPQKGHFMALDRSATALPHPYGSERTKSAALSDNLKL